MARSRLTQATNDLFSDVGAVLLSLIKGEQLEYPVTLDILTDASVKESNNYTYEAVVIEAKNVVGQTDIPTEVMPSAVQTALTVRLPIYVGEWNPATAYDKEEVIVYSGTYYKLLSGTARISSTPPSVDSLWEETVLNKIYVQIPSTLASTWSVQPMVDKPVYGFIELRVTEPTDPVFQKTWKPIRGMVEILFSPTDVVTS